MNSPRSTIWRFDEFEFDEEKLLLSYRGFLVKEAEKKSLQVLAAIVANKEKVTTYNEIIDKVWADNPHGVTSARINQYISKLQKVFAACDPEVRVLENIKGRGYRFRIPVEASRPAWTELQPKQKRGADETGSEPRERTTSDRGRQRSALGARKGLFIGATSIVIVILAIVYVALPNGDERELQKVVRDSQIYETLNVYRTPESFDPSSLDQYWTSDIDGDPNADRQRIKTAVQKLLADGMHYGNESRCDQLDVQSVQVDKQGSSAIVKTLEKWFVAVYDRTGALVKNRTIGPYFVTYFLKKDGRNWKIAKSSTARVGRPTPKLVDFQFLSPPSAGREFTISITGKDFEAATIYLELTGPGCPTAKPCTVPNSALLDRSRLSETLIENIPLTLAAGRFQMVVHNGDSAGSDPLYIDVP